MTSRGSRFALCGVALLFFASLFLPGRLPVQPTGIAPFFHRVDGRITIRLAGDFPHPGIQRLPVSTSPGSVIMMTLGPHPPAVRFLGLRRSRLFTGDVLTLSLGRGEPADLSISTMGVKEQMLLGIPLDPDRMGVEDWAALPGIGPVLAQRIVTDRQSNGAFGSLPGVLRVSGVGPGTLRRVERFFLAPANRP